jgi:periplasmic protein CpxP/Spy
MFLRKSLLGILGVVLTCGIVAFAQERQSQAPSTSDDTLRKEGIERRERHRERMGRGEGRGRERMGRRGHGAGHLMRDLNLTEEQRQQSRAIMQRRLENTKPQREELFQLREKRMAGTFTAEDGARAKALHQEIRTAMEDGQAEMAGVLTAEQKAKLEQLKQQRQEKVEQRMKERQERLNRNPQ